MITLTNATIFAEGRPRTKRAVRLDGDRITAITDAVVEQEAVDLEGAAVLPGLIDLHCHLCFHMQKLIDPPPALVAFRAAHNARLKLSAGVTTVRDMGGIHHVDLLLRDAIRSGLVPGPRVVASGKVIAATGGHIWYWAREADGPDDMRRAVREQVKAGADVVKLMVSGGLADAGDDPERMDFTMDELRTAVETAHALGRKVAAHIHPAAVIRAAVACGVDSIEHGSFLDDEAIEALVAKRAVLVPTLSVYDRMAQTPDAHVDAARVAAAKRLYERKVAALRDAVAAGVTIAAGTDSGSHFPPGDIVTELELLHAVGIPADEVLRIATEVNASVLGMGNEIGRIAPGYVADLVIVRGAPWERLSDLRHVVAVVSRGCLYRLDHLREVEKRGGQQ